MPVTVNVNNLSLAHKGSNGVSNATLPDVCKTPSPGGPVPIPYPNISMSNTLAKGTKTVKVDGGMMAAIKGSEYSMSMGDEPGTAGGVVSSTFKKESTWITYSFDVKMDGANACRLTDKKFQNHQNTVDMAGDVQPPLTPTPPCPPHSWARLPDDDTADDRLQKLKNSSQSGDQYNACLAEKYKSQGKSVDVSARYKCAICGEYQEVDLIVDGKPVECKAGNQGAKKKQTMNYVEISKQHFDGSVTVCFQSADKAAREAPHVKKWGAEANHCPCP